MIGGTGTRPTPPLPDPPPPPPPPPPRPSPGSSVARAKRAAPFSSALVPSSDKRIRPAARAAAVRSARDSARPSATRRANRRERCSTRSAWDSLVIEIELKRKSPSLIPGDELVVRLHDRPREWTRVELRRGGLGDAVTVERVRLRRECERDGDPARSLERLGLG